MSKILVADIECDGFSPSVIWVLGILDWETDTYTSYTGEDVAEGLMRLAEADLAVGHSFKSFDAKQIKRLTDGLIDLPEDKIYDTCEKSRKLLKEDMQKHGLKEWGEIFGFPKGDHSDWTQLSPEMITYCERDVRLTRMLFDFLLELENS